GQGVEVARAAGDAVDADEHARIVGHAPFEIGHAVQSRRARALHPASCERLAHGGSPTMPPVKVGPPPPRARLAQRPAPRRSPDQFSGGVVQSLQSDSRPVALAEALMTPASLPVFFRNFWMLLRSGADHSGRIEQWVPFEMSE